MKLDPPAHERQGDADHGNEPEHHAHIDQEVHEKNAPEAIGVHPGEPASLPLPEEEDAQQERCIQQEEGHRAEESSLLGPFAEDEVRFLLRDEAVTGHGSLSPALPAKPPEPMAVFACRML